MPNNIVKSASRNGPNWHAIYRKRANPNYPLPNSPPSKLPLPRGKYPNDYRPRKLNFHPAGNWRTACIFPGNRTPNEQNRISNSFPAYLTRSVGKQPVSRKFLPLYLESTRFLKRASHQGRNKFYQKGNFERNHHYILFGRTGKRIHPRN